MELSPDRLFRPERAVTRLEVAEWLTRADPRLPAVEAVPAFDDWGVVPEASREAVWVAAAGLMQGYPDGRFGPHDALPRSQAAALLWRYLCLPWPCGVGVIYAIRSYEQRDRLSQVDWAAFGWAVLEPGGGAVGAESRPRVGMDSTTSVYSLPAGWEEVVGQTRGPLMVFCDRPEVVASLLEHPSWWPEVAAQAAAAVRRLGNWRPGSGCSTGREGWCAPTCPCSKQCTRPSGSGLAPGRPASGWIPGPTCPSSGT